MKVIFFNVGCGRFKTENAHVLLVELGHVRIIKVIEEILT
jgi:hypothetical protein